MPEVIDINTLFGPWPAAATDLSVDELLGLMNRHGINYACTLSTVGMLLDHTSGNAATRAACSENSCMVPVATINPLAFYGGEGPHLRFKGDGFKLLRLFPGFQGWDPESAAFTALTKSLAVDPLPIMVDVNSAGIGSRVMRSIGDHPIPIILAGVDERSLSEAICLKRSHSNVFIETSGILSTGALKFVIEAVGPERVLFGSGAPARPMASVLGSLSKSGISSIDSEAIMGLNAKRILGL